MAEIVQLANAEEKALEEVNKLLQQFSDRKTSVELLRSLAQNPSSELWVAKEKGGVIGMATLIIITKLAGISTRIEDVVVDEAHRGKGLGKALCEKLIQRSKELGAYSIHLTSGIDRTAANALYQKLGFKKRDTNAYRMEL